MSDIAPEDRERLAKIKFREFFDECWNDSFGKAFDERVLEMGKTRNPQQGQQQHPTQPPQQAPEGTIPMRPRRRSLLEECFSQTFGL